MSHSVSEGPGYHEYFEYEELEPLENIPEEFRNLTSTKFRTLEREPAGGTKGGTEETLFIVPGFGVSVGQIGADRLLWDATRRYSRLITHDAVNYPTTQDFILWQYSELLRKSGTGPINLLGISLGGGTAIQLLDHLQKSEPLLYARCRKLLTLVSPVAETDLSVRWQHVLAFCRQLTALNRAGQDAGFLRAGILDLLVGGVKPLVRSSALEAETQEEMKNVFAYAGETFDGARKLQLNSLRGIEIVSFGLCEDSMAPNTRAAEYADPPGRHIEVKGKHTPRFYEEAKETYDRMILTELG